MIGNPSQDKKADAKTAVDELVKHSRDFYEDAKRCKAFLNDSCPSSRPEISALVSAVEHGIVSQILKESGGPGPAHKVLDAKRIHQLGEILNEDFAVDSSMAQWATETWAVALEAYQPQVDDHVPNPGDPNPGDPNPGESIFQKFVLWFNEKFVPWFKKNLLWILAVAVLVFSLGLAGPRLIELAVPPLIGLLESLGIIKHTPPPPPPPPPYEPKEVAQLKGHRGSVRSVAFSPDSQTLATSGEDGTIRLWNQKGQTLSQVKGNQNAINSINFSPDGQQLVSDAGGKIRLWKLQRNLQGNLQVKGLRDFDGHQKLIRSVKFSPDGKQLASTGDDGNIHLWYLQGQSPEKKWKADRKRVWDLAFSPDGKQLASAEAGGNVGLWNLKGKSLHQFTEHKSPVLSVAFSPDRKQLVSGCNVGMIRSWSLPDYQMKRMFQVNRAQLNSVAFSQDSNLILSGDNEGNIKLWRLNTQQQSPFWIAHQNSIIRKVVFSPDGKMFATAADDGIVKLWQLHNEALK
ncbi:MAG: WD40 repeat domain-containing protein [Kovacikia sp.]